MTTNITYLNTPLIVDYQYVGEYRAATYEYPAEYPDLVINKITAADSEIDISPLLDWRDVEQIEILIKI